MEVALPLLVEHRVDVLVDDAGDALGRGMEVSAAAPDRARANPYTSRSRSYCLRRRRLVVKKVAPGRDFEGLKVDLETLLLEHAGDQLGIFLGFRMKATDV